MTIAIPNLYRLQTYIPKAYSVAYRLSPATALFLAASLFCALAAKHASAQSAAPYKAETAQFAKLDRDAGIRAD
jgi:hypothetical protein